MLERSPELLPVGAGLLLQPLGLCALARLGVLPEVLERGARIERVCGETRSGRAVMDLPYADLHPACFGLGIHRAALLEVLVAALAREGIPLELGREVAALEHGADGRPSLVDARGERLGPYDLVVAADGSRSGLRAGTGLVRRDRPYAWGALWFVGELEEPRLAGGLHQVFDGASRLLGLLPSGPDPGSRRPTSSLFWSVRSDRPPPADGRELAALKAEMLRLQPAAAPLLEQIASPAHLIQARYTDLVLARWHTGRVVFLGDAGHAMSPHLGQGANLALHDAWVLGRCLTEHGGVEEALAAYSRERRSHLAFYQFASRWALPFFQSSLPPLGWLRDGLFPLLGRLRPFHLQQVRSLAGVKRGFLRRSLALDPALLADR